MNTEKSKEKNFILHGSILAMAGILVRIIGMLYRIPMVNIIGSEGNGLYSVAFNVYNIMLVLSSYGLPMAVSKLISGRFALKQYANADRVFKASLIVSIISGGVVSLLIFFGADFLEATLYSGYSGIAIPLKILAPTLFIVAVLGVFRGFCQGQGTMIPTAISQLLEQVVNAAVSIGAGCILVKIYKDSVHVAGYGAAGGTMGTAMGALFALLFMVFVYFLYKPTFTRKVYRDRSGELEEYSQIFKIIILTMIPIVLGQTFYQISAMIDDVMFGKIMVAKGVTDSVIKVSSGNYNSSYMILISLPMGVASAMSSSMLPSVVNSYSTGNRSEIRKKIRATLKANAFIAVPSFIGLTVLGTAIIQLIFPKYDAIQGGNMLKMGAISVVFYTLSTVTSSALQGIDKMSIPVKHSAISLAIHVILVYILLETTDLGIYALVIGNCTFPILIFILNLMSLRKYIGYKQEVKKTFGIPLLCSILMGICTGITYKILHIICHSNIISLMFAMIVAVIVYIGSIFVLKNKKIY